MKKQKAKKTTGAPADAAPKFEDILKILKADSSLIDSEGKDLLLGFDRIKKEKPTVENIKQLSRMKKLIENWYYAASGLNERIFFNVNDVLNFLQDEGYKIQERKLRYDLYKIKHQKDGTMLKKDVEEYAAQHLFKLDGSDKEETNAADKIKFEALIAEQKFKDMQFEAKIKEGQYILRSEVEQMLAARAAFLKDNLGQGFIHSRAPKMAEIIQGNTERIPELIEFYLKHIEEVFDYYSKPMRFEVPITLMEEKEDD